MKILCINPPQRINLNFIDYPPFTAYSIWYAAAYLHSCGFDTEILDAFALPGSSVSESDSEYMYAGIPRESFERHLERLHFDVALIQASQYAIQEPERRSLVDAIESVRKYKPEAAIIVADLYTGGMNYVDWDAYGLIASQNSQSSSADFILKYEFEEHLPKLLETLASGKKPYRRMIEGNAVGELPEFADIPYEFVDLNHFSSFVGNFYRTVNRSNAFKIGADCIPFKISRGCPFKCSFCSSGSIPGAHKVGWRKFSIEKVEKQLKFITGLSPRRRVLLLDESANSDPGHFEIFLDMLASYELKLEIPNGLRADLLNFTTLKKLSGLVSLLSISPECGSQEALDRLIGKKLKLESVERVATACMGIGLPLAMHYIVGLPGESREDLMATFDLARRMHKEYGAIPWIQYAVPVRGTALFKECVRRGLVISKLPDDLNPAFQSGPLIDNSPAGASPEEIAEMLNDFYNEPGMRH